MMCGVCLYACIVGECGVWWYVGEKCVERVSKIRYIITASVSLLSSLKLHCVNQKIINHFVTSIYTGNTPIGCRL